MAGSPGPRTSGPPTVAAADVSLASSTGTPYSRAAWGTGRRGGGGAGGGGRPTASQKVLARDAAQREVLKLRREVTEVRRAYEGALLKQDELRAEVGALNRDVLKKDDKLLHLGRMVEVLSDDRKSAERGRAEERLHVRRLELKLNASTAAADLPDRFSALKDRARGLKEKKDALETQLAVAKGTLKEWEVEIHALREALATKADELTQETGEPVSQKVLYSLARAREENIALSLAAAEERELRQLNEGKLRDSRVRVNELEERAMSHAHEMQDMQQELLMANAEKEQHRQSRSDSEARLGEARGEALKLEKKQEILERQLADERERSKALKDALAESESGTQKLNDQLYHDIIGTMEQEARRLQEERQSFQGRELELQRHVALLQSKLQHYQDDHDRAAQGAEASAREEFGHREKRLIGEIGNLTSEIEALSDVNGQLQEEAAQAHRQGETDRRKAENLLMQVSTLEAALGALKEDKFQSEAKLRLKLEKTLREYSVTLEEKDRLRFNVQSYQGKVSTLETSNQALDTKLRHLASSKQELLDSKSVLEERMIGEVVDARSRADQMSIQQAELQRKIGSYRDNEQRLESLIEAERQSVRKLVSQYERAPQPLSRGGSDSARPTSPLQATGAAAATPGPRIERASPGDALPRPLVRGPSPTPKKRGVLPLEPMNLDSLEPSVVHMTRQELGERLEETRRAQSPDPTPQPRLAPPTDAPRSDASSFLSGVSAATESDSSDDSSLLPGIATAVAEAASARKSAAR